MAGTFIRRVCVVSDGFAPRRGSLPAARAGPTAAHVDAHVASAGSCCRPYAGLVAFMTTWKYCANTCGTHASHARPSNKGPTARSSSARYAPATAPPVDEAFKWRRRASLYGTSHIVTHIAAQARSPAAAEPD